MDRFLHIVSPSPGAFGLVGRMALLLLGIAASRAVAGEELSGGARLDDPCWSWCADRFSALVGARFGTTTFAAVLHSNAGVVLWMLGSCCWLSGPS
mmetsp:Transcript_110797/g.353032  ORF Transcript_110797/g.353032 Transcript_110797/m.353032 type:complete len:96 (+) Transcript_110797:61-348(+)